MSEHVTYYSSRSGFLQYNLTLPIERTSLSTILERAGRLSGFHRWVLSHIYSCSITVYSY